MYYLPTYNLPTNHLLIVGWKHIKVEYFLAYVESILMLKYKSILHCNRKYYIAQVIWQG